MLAKAVTTLDVLSGGRAWLGIGAAWNEEESRGLGLPFPPHRRAVRAAGGDAADLPADVERRRGPVRRQALPAGRTLNSPQPLRRPHPPILIGGGGEKKTLRLVAQYAAGLQPVPRPELAAQARRAARALRRESAATTTTSRRRSMYAGRSCAHGSALGESARPRPGAGRLDVQQGLRLVRTVGRRPPVGRSTAVSFPAAAGRGRAKAERRPVRQRPPADR